MITQEQVVKHIEEKIAGTHLFLVEVKVRPGNNIEVTVDGDNGITIEDCTEIHRHLLNAMDREVEDYALEVSSPDLMKPLQVHRQYRKNIGRKMAVKKTDKSKIEGDLIDVKDESILLHTASKEAVEGKKGKKLVERDIEIPFSEISEARILISFK